MDYIIINPETTISKIQELFSSYYPNLKIEFYKKWHESGEGSPDKERITEDRILLDLNPNISKDVINLSQHLTARTIESEFEERDLHIQVFRKRNGTWLQTTTSDDKPLAVLNKELTIEN